MPENERINFVLLILCSSLAGGRHLALPTKKDMLLDWVGLGGISLPFLTDKQELHVFFPYKLQSVICHAASSRKYKGNELPKVAKLYVMIARQLNCAGHLLIRLWGLSIWLCPDCPCAGCFPGAWHPVTGAKASVLWKELQPSSYLSPTQELG